MSALAAAARALAHERGRALPVAMTRQVRLHPDATLLAVVSMSGEPGTVHGYAAGPVGAPRVATVPDPRDRDAQFRLLRSLAAQIDEPWRAARAGGTFPQLVVTGEPVARHLRELAQRLCRTKDAPPPLLALGERLAYWADRRDAPGQQGLIVCTDALLAHLTTGMSPAEEQHLGAVLEWVAPGAGGGGTGTVHQRTAAAELHAAGPLPRPEHDIAVLVPALARADRARRAGTPDPAADRAAAESCLPPLRHQWKLLDNACHVLRDLRTPGGAPLPDLPDHVRRRTRQVSALTRLCDAEADAFRSWNALLDDPDLRVGFSDSDRGAAFRLAKLEAAHECLAAARALGDPVAREQGLEDGTVLRGTVVGSRADGARAVVDVLTQGPAAPEPGQDWRHAGPGADRWIVMGVSATPSGTRVLLGRPAVHGPAPAAGQTVYFARSAPEWGSGIGAVARLAARTTTASPLLPTRRVPPTRKPPGA